MEKSKIIIISIVCVVLSLIMFFIGYEVGVSSKKEEKCPEVNKPIVTTHNDDEAQEKQLTQEQMSLFDKFSKYGKDIYKNNKYKNLSLDGDIPYASLSDLQKLGYDISNIEKICEGNAPAIYFDINNEFSSEYTEEPLQIILDCYRLK